MTAFNCTLATGSLLTFLSVSVTVGSSLFMPFSTPASNQPVRTSTGSTSLVMGSLEPPPQAAAPAARKSLQAVEESRRVWESCVIFY